MGKYDELKKLAEAATPGPWQAIDYGSYDGSEECWYVETSAGPADIFDGRDGTVEPNHWNPARGKADMQFIAAANPAVVLALIAENERLHADNRAVWETITNTIEKLGIDTEAAKSAAGKPSDVLVAHVDRLRAELERARAEAERYRWLNNAENFHAAVSNELWRLHGSEQFGERIDAAMGKGGRADG